MVNATAAVANDNMAVGVFGLACLAIGAGMRRGE